MGNKKNIDNFFQEQFKNFEANPPDSVWENINNELEKDEKEERKIVPIWWKLSGIAAGLLFLIAIGVSQFSSDDNINTIANEDDIQVNKRILNSETSVVENEIISVTNKNDQQLNQQLPVLNTDKVVKLNSSKTAIQGDDLLVTSSDKSKKVSENSILSNKKSYKDQIVENSNNQLQEKSKDLKHETLSEKRIVTTNKVDENTKNRTIDKQLKIDEQLKEGFVVNESDIAIDKNVNQSKYTQNQITKLRDSFKEELVIDNAVVYLSDPNSGNSNKKAQTNMLTADDKHKNKHLSIIKKDLAVEDYKQYQIANNQEINEGSFIGKKVTDNVLNQSQDDDLKKDLNSSVSEVVSGFSNTIDEVQASLPTEKNTADTSIVKSTSSEKSEGDEDVMIENKLPVEQTIEEAIAEQELKKDEDIDEDKEEEMYNKWKIAPNIAPVYYNSLTTGSPIDGDFKGNKKKGQFTTSYGIGVGYAVNKRLSVRTGINQLEVGYDTQDVAVYSSPETSDGPKYKNINFSSAGASMSIAGAGSYSENQIPAAFSSLFDSSLNQRFGYLEVPLELSYKLSDKKLRVDVIAGMSTFFLNKNEIYSENKVKTTYIGEANNLNKMSYSTNLGIGFEYKISKSLNFNFDPTFKYQLNAFSNDSGNFKPYILGIYTGLSYRF